MKNRSKIIATLLTVGLLIPTTVCAETGVKFTKDNINFVDNLGNEHSITQNERVFAMGDTVGENQKILYKTYEGWVHKDYLKKYVTKEMYSTVRLNLRKEPNTECEVLEVVNVNTPLNIVECHIGNKEWYKGVKDNGTEYYVYGEYVSENKQPKNNGKYLGKYKVTHYCGCQVCCGEWSKYHTTASGNPPVAGVTVACNSLPFGTQIVLNGHTYTVQDRGGMGGNVIDIYCNSHQEALNNGMYYADVYLK